MSDIFETAIVEKRNVLNELRANNLTLQELRFFSIYLSKINPYNKNTRIVKFKLSDFKKIMNFKELKLSQLKTTTDSLLSKVVHIPLESGGYDSFQLFKKCRIDKEISGEWYVYIDAHDDALPLMFDFKDRYFKYELWNALRLKSANQIRMYEILKQFEYIGWREISVSELRELIGIAPNEYPRWNNFKARVLDSCQEALKESTDICFTYERGKTGTGGKWLTIIFHIEKNNDYIDQLTLDEFIDVQPSSQSIDDLIEDDVIDGQATFFDEEIEYGTELANILGRTVLNNEFSPEEVQVLQDLVLKALPSADDSERVNYLTEMLHKMNAEAAKKERNDELPIASRFAYLKGMLEKDIEKKQTTKSSSSAENSEFDASKYDFVINNF